MGSPIGSQLPQIIWKPFFRKRKKFEKFGFISMSYVFFGLGGRQAACAAVYMQTRKSKQQILAFVSEMCLNLQF
jgi:hypothetical protein